MRNPMMRALVLHRLSFTILILICISGDLWASKFSIGGGAFMINAKVGDTDTSVSNLGAYKIQLHTKLEEQFEFILSYTILMEKVYGGDKGFGPLIGFSYYPKGVDTVNLSSVSDVSVLSIKKLNPYFKLGFAQRQYQSIRSSYSGFALGGGVEVGWSRKVALFADLEYSLLGGPNEGEATEVNTTAGISYNY